MGFKIKNSLTGEFEKLPILTLKGEKGETGGVEEYNKVDYMGNKYETLKQANDANVEYAVKTAIGEFNYLDYDGQHITATDTIEGRSKSAILSGQTLVNQSTTSELTFENAWQGKNIEGNTLQSGKKYFVSFNLESDNSELTLQARNGNSFVYHIHKGFTKGKNILSFILEQDVNGLKFQVGNDFNVNISNIVILEYQDGMENWDIPYFTGMQSVKMPVLTTTGKNLFDNKILANYIIGEKDGGYIIDCYKLYQQPYILEKPLIGTFTFTYTAKEEVGGNNPRFLFYFNDGTTLQSYNGQTSKEYETYSITINNKSITKIGATYSNLNNIKWIIKKDSIQLEQGSTATTYEPFKSNILTVNEPVELRGIDDVKDELNCLTGELTERVGEIVLDGSEDWKLSPSFSSTYNSYYFVLNVTYVNKLKYTNDKYQILSASDILGKNIGLYIGNSSGKVAPFISCDKMTLSEFKDYLSKNPVTVQYQLTTESIKTVDLSDNHVYSYKDVTHYDCSSAEGSLVPTLSVKVPTDVQATIAQQRETIQTLNSENERLNQIQEALKASMLDSQVQLMNLSWDTDFEVFTLRESIAPKDFLLASRTGSNIDKFSQAKFIIENDCPDLEKLNSQIEYYFSKDVFSQEQFEELTDLISIVKGGNGCEY